MGLYESQKFTDATYVKQKKSVVDPTRKKVAADTGTYREGRRGLLGGTTAWGRGDEDGPRPPLLLLPPGITLWCGGECVCSATAMPKIVSFRV